MTKYILLAIAILAYQISTAQYCKIFIKNSSNYFFEPDNDDEDCKDDNNDYYYTWTGSTKNNRLEGDGTLKEYDKSDNELISQENASFSNGLRNGKNTSYSYGTIMANNAKFNNEFTCFYVNGFIEGLAVNSSTYIGHPFFKESVEQYFMKRSLIDKSKTYYLKLTNKSGSIFTFTGLEYDSDKDYKYYTGKLFENGYLKNEGNFKIQTWKELVNTSSGYIQMFTPWKDIAQVSGDFYPGNGVKVSANKYQAGNPIGKATLYYPNGDKIESSNFDMYGVNGYGIYYWANGARYEGQFRDTKITKEGRFYNSQGTIKSTINDDLLLGIATVGLVAWGISELFPSNTTSSSNKSSSVSSSTNNSSTNYSGSYSAYSSTSSSSSNNVSSSSSSNNRTTEVPKCSACGGRGVCLQCNGRGTQLCKNCDGKGTEKVYDDARNGTFNWYTKDAPCSKCSGSGIKKCNSCSGKGTCYRCYGKGTSY